MTATRTPSVWAGPFGYRADGLNIEQVGVLLATGGLHRVAYDGRTKATIPGSLVDDFDPLKDKVYTYSQVRRACQKARTEERLYGTMSLVGPAGSMTRFGVELGRMSPFSALDWVQKLTFAGNDPTVVYALMLALYAEIND